MEDVYKDKQWVSRKRLEDLEGADAVAQMLADGTIKDHCAVN